MNMSSGASGNTDLQADGWTLAEDQSADNQPSFQQQQNINPQPLRLRCVGLQVSDGRASELQQSSGEVCEGSMKLRQKTESVFPAGGQFDVKMFDTKINAEFLEVLVKRSQECRQTDFMFETDTSAFNKGSWTNDDQSINRAAENESVSILTSHESVLASLSSEILLILIFL